MDQNSVDRQMDRAVSEIVDGDPFFEKLKKDDYFKTRKNLEVALRTAYRAGYRQAESDDEQAVIQHLREQKRRQRPF